MTDTASMQIYRIRDDISLNHILTYLTENKGYFRLEFYQDGLLIQERHALCSGSEYSNIADFINYSFGITILESVFDLEINKIISVAERGIIGDILASQRFYRRARPVTYEDNFGKYYQNINVPFRDTQIRRHFPILTSHRGKKIRSRLSSAGSSRVDIRKKLSFFELILLSKDLAELVNTETPRIFNRNLKPLAAHTEKFQSLRNRKAIK